MKITTLILLMALMQVSAASVAQRITFVKKNASLEQVFQEITRQTGYEVFYGDKKFDDSRKINVAFKDATLDEVLKTCLQHQRASYVIEEKSIIIKPTAESTFLERLADRWAAIDVHGRVVDQEGKPLPGATVKVKGLSKSVSANGKGEFYLEKVEEGDVLLISFIGYVSKELSAQKELGNIVLEVSNNILDQVQVIAYGTTTRRLSTGNVSTVKSEDIEKQPVNNPILALQGRIPGMEITQSNGISGSNVKVQIRGINSMIQGTQPLYIIDGVPYASDLYSNPGYGGLAAVLEGGINPFSFINPSDIESIEVLKDADATAIYGSRAANGVILISTKKGQDGPMKIDLNLQSGFGNITRKTKMLNTQQYLEMRKEAFKNDNVTPTTINAKDLKVWDQNANTDWQDFMIGGTSKYTNAQTSISGGSNNVQFLVGGAYKRETTVFPGDWSDQKASLHFNINNSSLNQKLKIMLSGSFLSDNNQLPISDYTQYITLAPNAPNLYKEDGTLDWNNYPNNPFRDKENRYTAKTNNLIANTILSYNILPGLETKVSLGYNNILLNEKTASPMSANSPSSGIKTGGAAFNTNVLKSWIVEPQINYQFNLASSKLGMLVGATIQKRDIEGQVVYGGGYTDDGLLGSLAAASTISKGESVFEQYRYGSLFSRLSYNYKDKYLLNLTGRRDGSSRFGPGRQYGNFGAVGSAWIFSKEEIIRNNLPFLSFGKFRASYGTSGNEPGTNYAFLELYNFTTSNPYGGGNGIYPNNLPDAVYSWEVNKKFEAALEFGFLNDRVLLTASYYRNRSSNQLVTYPLATTTGFSGITANLAATIQNKGWEFTFNTINVKTRKFEWKSGFNLTSARNKLISFPSFENSYYTNLFKVGEPINIRFLYKSAGIDSETGKYQFFDHNGKLTQSPDGIKDRTVILRPTPKYYGGFQNSFNYKRLSIDLNIQFINQIGQSGLFLNSTNPGRFSSLDGRGNQPFQVLNRWQTVGNSGNDFAKFSQNTAGFLNYRDARGSDLGFSDASYIRLKNVAFSYSFSNDLTKKMRIQGLRLYIYAQNLITISGYNGVDPENQSLTLLPPLRVITGGIQITL